MNNPFRKFSFRSQALVFDDYKGDYEIAQIYREMRDRAFALKPDEIGLNSANTSSVWGILIESGYEKAVATLLALADSTVSFYFSNGSGIIGAGQHTKVAEIAKNLLQHSQLFLQHCELAQNHAVPQRGQVRFYFFTFSSVCTVEASKDDLGNNRHLLSPLFHAAHQLITEIRFVDETQKNSA